MEQKKHWLFTINNPEQIPQELIKKLDDNINNKNFTFYNFQLEKGEKTGTLHYQGYVQLGRKRTMQGVRRLLGFSRGEGGGYVGRCDGSAQSNLDYTSKQSTRVAGPWTGGTFNGCIGGEVVNRGDGNFKKRKEQQIEQKELPNKRVVVFLGPPGTGKTTKAIEFLGGTYHEVNSKSAASFTRWLGEYSGEQSLLIDEWKIDDFAVNELAAILDKRTHKITTMAGGKSVCLVANKVALTTNMSIEQFNKYVEANPKIYRRIDECKIFKNNPHTIDKKIIFTEIN